MKLYTPNREFFVFYAHNFVLFSLGSNLQTIGQAFALNHQRVITCSRKRIGHAFKEILSVVLNEGSLAMHHPVIPNDVAAKNMADALMAEANAERRDL